MDKKELLKNIVKVLDSKKAEDINVIEIEDLTIIADYFVIATALNSTHIKALVDEVEFQIEKLGVTATKVEGDRASGWLVMDYDWIMVHVFVKDSREFYKLERLWADGKPVDISDIIEQ